MMPVVREPTSPWKHLPNTELPSVSVRMWEKQSFHIRIETRFLPHSLFAQEVSQKNYLYAILVTYRASRMQSLAEIWGLVFPGPLYMTAKSTMFIFSAHARFTLHLSNQLNVLFMLSTSVSTHALL